MLVSGRVTTHKQHDGISVYLNWTKMDKSPATDRGENCIIDNWHHWIEYTRTTPLQWIRLKNTCNNANIWMILKGDCFPLHPKNDKHVYQSITSWRLIFLMTSFLFALANCHDLEWFCQQSSAAPRRGTSFALGPSQTRVKQKTHQQWQTQILLINKILR